MPEGVRSNRLTKGKGLPLKTGDFLQGLENVSENKLLNYSISSTTTRYSAKESDIEWNIMFRSCGGKGFLKLLVSLLQQQEISTKTFGSPSPYKEPLTTPGQGRSVLQKRPSFMSIDRKVGVASLEKKNEDYRQKNEDIINIAFKDLYMLMLSAEEVLTFANNYQKALSREGFSNLFHKAATSVFKRSSQVDTHGYERFLQYRSLEDSFTPLADIWFATNLEVHEPEFLSPARFREIAEQWNDSGLPIILRKYRSGVLALQLSNQAKNADGLALLNWLEKMQCDPQDANENWNRINGGVTVVEIAEQFDWSLSFALEELESFEEKGDLCRDTNEGEIRFWRNKLLVPA